jgi:hypothetical protein
VPRSVCASVHSCGPFSTTEQGRAWRRWICEASTDVCMAHCAPRARTAPHEWRSASMHSRMTKHTGVRVLHFVGSAVLACACSCMTKHTSTGALSK